MRTRDILNSIKWDPRYEGKENQYFIQYTHRGAMNDNMVISYSQITEVNPDSFEYLNKSTNETVRIPFHRIEKIFNNLTHEVLYKKQKTGVS
jgi:uncharacterized protein (UPF0248 family)